MNSLMSVASLNLDASRTVLNLTSFPIGFPPVSWPCYETVEVWVRGNRKFNFRISSIACSIRLCSILFAWFDNRTHTKQVNVRMYPRCLSPSHLVTPRVTTMFGIIKHCSCDIYVFFNTVSSVSALVFACALHAFPQSHLGQFLLGMCRWHLRAPTFIIVYFWSISWPIISPILVTFGHYSPFLV